MRSSPGGPFAALRGLATSLLGTGHSRLQLLGNEIQSEKLRILRELGLAAGMMFCAGVAVLLAMALLVVLLWDHRVAVLALGMALFAGLAALLYAALRRSGRDAGNPFAASLAELQEDLRQLRAANPPATHEKKPG